MDDLHGMLKQGKISGEVFNLILKYTFTVDTSGPIVDIGPGYRPPRVLGVNRETRKEVAKSYYGSTHFRIKATDHWEGSEQGHQWLTSLSFDHFEMTRHITFELDLENVASITPDYSIDGLEATKIEFHPIDDDIPAWPLLIKRLICPEHLNCKGNQLVVCETVTHARLIITAPGHERYDAPLRIKRGVRWSHHPACDHYRTGFVPR